MPGTKRCSDCLFFADRFDGKYLNTLEDSCTQSPHAASFVQFICSQSRHGNEIRPQGIVGKHGLGKHACTRVRGVNQQTSRGASRLSTSGVIAAGLCKEKKIQALFNWTVASRTVSCDRRSVSVAENAENATVCFVSGRWSWEYKGCFQNKWNAHMP